MGWESILGFIVIIFVNSLFNQGKRKNQQNKRGAQGNSEPRPVQPRQQGPVQPKPVQSQPARPMTASPQQPVESGSQTRQAGRSGRPKNALERMFEELQNELAGTPAPAEPEARPVPDLSELPPYENDYSSYFEESLSEGDELEMDTSSAASQSAVDPIRKKRKATRLFNKPNEVVRGIVMAEVLGKPKALR